MDLRATVAEAADIEWAKFSLAGENDLTLAIEMDHFFFDKGRF